ncbi:MAG: phosphoribosylformylglycinamidine cyclo-ligase [Omnitrophica bacterium RIFCSPHIGHO2_02_FULL_63_14]|nr:MAG: phosphoribosylformylglycinamidine cyclo-ligase [Omnitrophica bacterium RIFCSPHIGHO2_02_FULL_63_14]
MLTYKKSGVDVDRADRFVESIKPLARLTRRREVVAGIGGFGALCRLPLRKYKDPILASSTDGVGTKLKLAALCGRYEGLGVDLVGMNVNDVLTLGAEPLFFLDYFAIGAIKPRLMRQVIKGVASGCRQAGCALIGGETAEMPGVYANGDFDLAGFCVGVVEASKVIDGRSVKPGHVIVGVASSGFHSNGFSLVRKVFPDAFVKAHAEEILRPTRIYVKSVLSLLAAREPVLAMAHVTGGGFIDNIPRVLPPGCGARIHAGAWPVPRIFGWVQERGRVPANEMYRTFNMGIGFVLVVPKERALKVISHLGRFKDRAWVIGEVIKGNGVTVQ